MTLVAASLQHVANVWQTASTFTGKFLLLWVAMSAPLCAVQMMIIVAVVSIPFVFGPSRQQQHKLISAKLDCHNCKKPLSRRSLSLVIFAGLVFVILPTIFITFGHLLFACAVHKVAPHFRSLYFYSESSSTSFGSPHVAVDAYLHKSISTRIRSTRHGVLRGLLYQFSNENWGQLNATDVEVYLGIRYAAAPIGDFRFMPPSSSPSWTGVMNATEFGPACPQQVPNSRHLRQTGTPRARLEQIERLTPFLLNQSEDCLFLNIYTPVLSHNDLSPVVIFIHGESYEWNSGNAYDGSVLASYAQAVVITFNFRLGVLGYLSTGDDASRGNYALMDMLAAITWVRDNINVFGGDPTRITLMGHDSGAASASLLMSLPQTLSTTTSSSSSSASSSSLAAVGNGAQQTLSLQRRAASSAAVGTTTTKASLFQRVILISGSALEPSAMSYNPVIYAKIIAEQFSCPTNVMRELVNCLQGLSVGDILQAQSTIRVPRFLTAFGPVVDGYFVTKPPEQLFSRRDPSDNPYCRFGLLFGVSSTGGMKYLTEEDFQRPNMDSQRQQRISRTLVRNLFTYHMEEILQAINFEYAGGSGTSAGGDNSARYQQVREQTVNMLGDALSAAPLVKAGSLHSSHCDSHHQLYSNSKPDTFFYVFNYHPQSERTTDDKPHPTFTSTMNRDERPLDSYQDELSYIFGAPLLKNSLLSPFARHSYTERDAVVSQGVMTYFGNFLVTGDPMKSADSTTNFRPHRQTSQRLSPPAEPVSRSHIRRRFIEHISWPPFTVNSSFVQSGTTSSAEGAYLSISLEPAVRSQYRQHYMSFWNDLVPQLNSADENNAFSALADNGHAPPPPSSLLPSFNHHNTAHSQHHLLSNFDDMSTYEGTVLPAAHILTAAQMIQYNTRSNSGNTKRMLAGSLNSGESLQTSGLGGNDLQASDWSVPGHNTSTTVESDGNFPGDHVSKPFRSSSINGSATASRANNATVSSPLGSYTAYGAAAAVAVVVLCLAGCLIVCIRRQCQKCCDKTKRNDSNASSNDRAIAAFNSTSAGAAKPQQQQIANGKKSASLPNHYGNNHSNHYHAAHAKLLPNDDGELLRQTVPLESSLDNGQLPHVRAGNPSLRHNTATLPPPNSATVRNQMTIAAPSLTLDWANHNAPHNNRASLYAQQNGALPNNSNQQLKLSYSLPGPQQKYWPAAANYLLNSENTAPTIVASTDSKHSHSSSDPQQHYEQQQGLVGARIAASASTAPLYFPAPPLQMSRSQHHRLNAGYPHPDHYQQSRSQQQSLFVQNHYTNQHPTTIATVGHLTSNDESWSANHQNPQSVSSSAQQFAPPHTNQIVVNDHRQTGTTPTIAALSVMSNGSVLMKSKPPNAQLYPPAQSTASHNSSVDQNQRSAYTPADTHHQGAATSEFYETDFDNNALGQQRESGRRQHRVHLPNTELNNDTKSHHKARREDQQAVAAVANGHRPPSSGSAMLNGSSVDSNNNIDDTDETAV